MTTWHSDPSQIPKTYTHYASVALFFFFGLKMLFDGLTSKGGENEELAEVEEELSKAEAKSKSGKRGAAGKSRATPSKAKQQGPSLAESLGVTAKALSMTFLAEWGDRSQIATVGCGPVGRLRAAHARPLESSCFPCLAGWRRPPTSGASHWGAWQDTLFAPLRL